MIWGVGGGGVPRIRTLSPSFIIRLLVFVLWFYVSRGVICADVIVEVKSELAVGGVAVPFLYYFFELVDNSVSGGLTFNPSSHPTVISPPEYVGHLSKM